MENFSETTTMQSRSSIITSTHTERGKSAHGVSGFFPALVNMIAEDGNNFFRYIKKLGLSRENNLVVLSSRHHYFYDENEMQRVKTLVNLKTLNLIKYLDEFVYSLYKILPSDSNFIGCFSDNGISIGNKISLLNPVKSLRKKISLIDMIGARSLTRKKVTEILESIGFSIVDMTEINGTTYFCARTLKSQAALSA